MAGGVERTLIIRFMDGTEQMYVFPAQSAESATVGDRIQEMLSARHLLLEVEGRLVAIPFQGVKAVEVSPPPEKLPPGVIRGVTFAP